MQGMTPQQQDVYLQQYMQAMQGYQQPQQQVPGKVTSIPGTLNRQQHQQQQARPLAQAVLSVAHQAGRSAQQDGHNPQRQQQKSAPGLSAEDDDDFGTFEAAAKAAAKAAAPAIHHKPAYDRCNIGDLGNLQELLTFDV